MTNIIIFDNRNIFRDTHNLQKKTLIKLKTQPVDVQKWKNGFDFVIETVFLETKILIKTFKPNGSTIKIFNFGKTVLAFFKIQSKNLF